jgi:hypothetical protein
MPKIVQHLQHQSVAAQRHDYVGFRRGKGAVALLQRRARGTGGRSGSGDKGETRSERAGGHR